MPRKPKGQIPGQSSITRFFGAGSAKPQGSAAPSSSGQPTGVTNCAAASTATQGTFKAPLPKPAHKDHQAATSVRRPLPAISTAAQQLARGITEAAEHTSLAASGTHRFSCSRSTTAQHDSGRPDGGAATARLHFRPPAFNGDNLNEQQLLAATAPIHAALLMLAGKCRAGTTSQPAVCAVKAQLGRFLPGTSEGTVFEGSNCKSPRVAVLYHVTPAASSACTAGPAQGNYDGFAKVEQ